MGKPSFDCAGLTELVTAAAHTDAVESAVRAEMYDVAASLLADEAGFITGTVVPVDGGLSM